MITVMPIPAPTPAVNLTCGGNLLLLGLIAGLRNKEIVGFSILVVLREVMDLSVVLSGQRTKHNV